MRDWSINLPSWAVQFGYRLEGGMGTFDELFLYKGFRIVKAWTWLDRVPNLFEMEEVVKEVEERRNGC